MKSILLMITASTICIAACSQTIQYPAPVSYITLSMQQQSVKMAYMDVTPAIPNGKTVLLFHGKNFNGYYWKDVIAFLRDSGYRVIVPDQVGFGYSAKPAIAYSFHQLAANTRSLLDTLGITGVYIIAHSMGGMLASRFILMYPDLVQRIVYENPIGLEDYRKFVPYQNFDQQYTVELKSDINSLRKYQQSYYPEWKPEYEAYVQAQWEATNRPNFNTGAWASAATYQMIFEQPVLYELGSIKTPALLIIGQADRTVVGKNLLSPGEAKMHGDYPALGKWLNKQLVNSTLVELDGVGHIPHVQDAVRFRAEVLSFFREK